MGERVKQRRVLPGDFYLQSNAVKMSPTTAVGAEKIVAITGLASSGHMACALADHTTGLHQTAPLYIAIYGVSSGSLLGFAVPWKVLKAVNTNGSSIGANVYLSTAGGWTLTPPATGARVIGQVLAVDATTGVILIDPQGKASLVGGESLRPHADGSPVPGVPAVFSVVIADASGDTDVVVSGAWRVINVTVLKTATAGGASDTITVKKGASAITEAIDINVADKKHVMATDIDDANATFASGDTLKVTAAKSTNVASVVYVYALPV